MKAQALENKNPLQDWIDQYRSYFDIFLDAFCVVDCQGKVLEFNIAFTELTGESHRKILKVGQLSELIKIDASLPYPSETVIRTGQSVRLDEVKGSTKAYSELNLIIGAVPVFGSQSQLLGAVLTFRNVSAEVMLQLKYEERKKESVTDGLTRMFNKTYLEEHLKKLLKNSLREKRPLTLIMGDVDHFKRVNDTYGHQAGDYVLKLVATIIKNMMRETDLAGRFGGEEFMFILNNCDADGAKIFCERLRKNIESTLFIFEGKRIPITISLGTSSLMLGWSQDVNLDELQTNLIHQADSALYQAKANGRNRFCQFEDKPSKK
ncbi:MAG: sensor domain-containing diguanylate cyclase [Proteobacteria bacterium]|nr:sensor domain-containing diguanylate cyclase [Pseudomonadota bacterium]NDC24943.1 sensor domain-containing diguanylate cyclase [Pseudomonadota bacterium]NDD03300.1 sensor domain-containing diguanylate cyclase [Pseudomonadota bacterium]NDG27378.1 sensor domain-containing diguanylate cyclase [Pseudomonadota bacterium]